jgi:hypothetical protein
LNPENRRFLPRVREVGLGLDHQTLAVTQGARQIRLTSAEGGKVVREILA